MIKILYGDEPYKIDRILSEVKKGRDAVIETETFDEEVAIEISTPSFFGKKLIIIKAASLKDVNSSFCELAENSTDEVDVYLVIKNMDKRLALFKKLEQVNKKQGGNLIQECQKLTEPELGKYIHSQFQEKGKKLPVELLPVLLKRLNYESCNLYEVNLVIDKITAITEGECITQAEVEEASEDNSEGNVFKIFTLLCEGKVQELMREVDLIPANEGIKVLGLLLSKFRLVYKASLFPNKAEAAKGLNIAVWKIPELRKEAAVISECMDIIVEGMSDIKFGILNEETAVKSVVLRLFHKIK